MGTLSSSLHRYQFPNGIKLYAENVDEIKHIADGEPIEIPIITESSLSHLESILNVSKKLGNNLYSFPYNDSEIIYQPLKHGDDFIDGIKYQRHDEHKLVDPILKTICSIDEFYTKFYSNQDRLPPMMLSKRDFDKIDPKPICFDKKSNYKKYVDSMGYIYLIPRKVPWSKKGMELYNHFKDKPNVVYGRIRSATFGYLAESKVAWFESEEQLARECDEINIKYPATMGGATYDIIHRGFNATHPKDRKLIVRLPYFNFDNVKDIKSASNSWIDSGKGFKWIDNSVSGYNRPHLVEFFEDVTKKYLEYKNN